MGQMLRFIKANCSNKNSLRIFGLDKLTFEMNSVTKTKFGSYHKVKNMLTGFERTILIYFTNSAILLENR